MRIIKLILIIVLLSSQSFGVSIIHRVGTDIEENRRLVSLIPEEYLDRLDYIDFRADSDAHPKYCGIYTFHYDGAKNNYFITSANIVLWCRNEWVLWHEVGHNIEALQGKNVTLNEDFANEFADNNLIGGLKDE